MFRLLVQSFGLPHQSVFHAMRHPRPSLHHPSEDFRRSRSEPIVATTRDTAPAGPRLQTVASLQPRDTGLWVQHIDINNYSLVPVLTGLRPWPPLEYWLVTRTPNFASANHFFIRNTTFDEISLLSRSSNALSMRTSLQRGTKRLEIWRNAATSSSRADQWN